MLLFFLNQFDLIFYLIFFIIIISAILSIIFFCDSRPTCRRPTGTLIVIK